MPESRAVLDLSGRTALVTGGGSGIGEGIARELATAGATVVLVGRRADRLEAVRAEIASGGGRAEAIPFDLGDGARSEQLLELTGERVGEVDVLVHSAGIQLRRPAAEFELADADAVWAIHVRAALALSQAVGRRLIARQAPGAIVYVGSLSSSRLGLAGGVAYAIAKSGLLGLMRTLAIEWAPQRVRVNTVAVGFVATEMTREIDDLPERKALTDRVPLGRLGEAAEIGRAVTFLCSDYASYITGEVLTVDGGWSVA